MWAGTTFWGAWSLRRIIKLMSLPRQKPRHKPHHPRSHFTTAVTTVRKRRRGRDVEIKSRPRRMRTNALTTTAPLEQTNLELGAFRAQTRAGRSLEHGAILHVAVSRTAAQRIGASSRSLWRSGGKAARPLESHYAHAIRSQHRPAHRIIHRIRPQLVLRPLSFVAARARSEPRDSMAAGSSPHKELGLRLFVHVSSRWHVFPCCFAGHRGAGRVPFRSRNSQWQAWVLHTGCRRPQLALRPQCRFPGRNTSVFGVLQIIDVPDESHLVWGTANGGVGRRSNSILSRFLAVH